MISNAYYFSFRWFLIGLIYYTCNFPEPNTLGQIGNFSSRIGEKNILFGFENEAEFRPQILEIESPVLYTFTYVFSLCMIHWHYPLKVKSFLYILQSLSVIPRLQYMPSYFILRCLHTSPSYPHPPSQTSRPQISNVVVPKEIYL